MSQYPGALPPGQPPGGPWYGQPGDPYAPPPSDPYFGTPPGDPYGQGQYQQWQGQQPPPGYPPPYPPGYWQQPPPPPPPPTRRARGGSGAAIAGIFLVLLGAWFLFRDQVDFDLGQAWPLIAVVLGVLMVIAAFIPRRGR
jgi:hypothetical protein